MTITDVPRIIDLDHVTALGDVDRALATFFDDAVRTAADASGAPEREIRDWVEHELISEQGFRTQALQGPGPYGAAVLLALENGHVIRADARRGAQWYELSHDRLVAPVRDSNAVWRAVHLSMLQLGAMAWIARGRPDGLLLSNDLVPAAEAWADEHPGELSADDREFLSASAASAAGALIVAKARRRVVIVSTCAAVLAVFALFGGVVSCSKTADARRLRTSERAARTAESAAVEQRTLAEQNRARADAVAATARANAATARAVAAEARTRVRVCDQLVDVQTELRRVNALLVSTEAALNDARNSLAAANSEIVSLQGELAAVQQQLADIAATTSAAIRREIATKLDAIISAVTPATTVDDLVNILRSLRDDYLLQNGGPTTTIGGEGAPTTTVVPLPRTC